MTTRAKFVCNKVSKRLDHTGAFFYDAELMAVYSGSEENKTFWKHTPAGNITLSTIRSDHFEPGREYYVDFTLVEIEASPPPPPEIAP
jgi:hypothetical protein